MPPRCLATDHSVAPTCRERSGRCLAGAASQFRQSAETRRTGSRRHKHRGWTGVLGDATAVADMPALRACVYKADSAGVPVSTAQPPPYCQSGRTGARVLCDRV